MAEIVRMPKMSDTMEEGTIAVWHKKVGDVVESGELMAEIETDKATMEYESYDDGTVLYLGAAEGDAILVDGVLAVIGNPGEDYAALLAGESGEAASATVEGAAVETATESIDISGINAEIVRMPKMSDTMEEGTIAVWHKKVGDVVESGELMAEVETDKATMEYESYNDGTVLYLGAEEGGAVAVDGIMAVVGHAGADFETLLKAEKTTNLAVPVVETLQVEVKKEVVPTPVAAPVSAPVVVSSSSDERIKASPLAKKLASDKGFDISKIKGTGPNGRVVKLDVEGFTPLAAPAAASKVISVMGQESFEDLKLTQMRKVIARRLSESKFSAPHFYITMDIDMDQAIASRKSMNAMDDVKISFNDLVVKATAGALKKHPNVNSMWLGDKIRVNHHIHVGVAIATPDGLFVPKLPFTDSMSLSQISASVRELAGKAKDKTLTPAEMDGSTFTISNLGMFGIEEFTAIVNPPSTCILAIGGIKQVPVVKNGAVVPGNVMKVTLSCDHRAVDGAIGAAFLKTFKELLEDPIRLLV
jgi:pyruvate dehydrogenase E2 component (dihydrolipoamide acetyltransferase)